MKHISRIILTIWILCGLVAGNAYSFAQSYGFRNSINSNSHFTKEAPSNKGIYSECHKKHSEAILECENELEDDNEKQISDAFSFSYNHYKHSIYLAHYSYTECAPRSNSLNILYCVFRI